MEKVLDMFPNEKADSHKSVPESFMYIKGEQNLKKKQKSTIRQKINYDDPEEERDCVLETTSV